MSAFSERIIKLKNDKQLLQKDIAEQVGVSLRTYQYYEKNQMEPKMSNLISLAKFFNVSIDYLVGLSDNPEVNK